MIDQYKQAFQEEAREILPDLESALLQLNGNAIDNKSIERVLRALHTIKSSGETLGFDNVSKFTRQFEKTFARVRNGKLQASADLINLAQGGVTFVFSAGHQIVQFAEFPDKAAKPARLKSLPVLRELWVQSEGCGYFLIQYSSGSHTFLTRPSLRCL
jgi:chemotaxis protein histidine kinase CheA